MTQTLTDISGLVDSAFGEMDCVADTNQINHGGDKFGYYLGHGCWPNGFLCTEHFKRHLEVKRPWLHKILREYGSITCGDCGKQFSSVDDFSKVYPL